MPGHIGSVSYNARGQVTAVTYANGVTTTNTYNDAPLLYRSGAGADAMAAG